jgi:rfaE bifunctional protein nucleotidyltransferase chain/domain
MKYKGCFLFKPNQPEAETISGEKNIHKILHFIKDKIECKNILLTRGKEGMILYQQSFEHAPHRGAIVQTVPGNLVEVSSAQRIENFNVVNNVYNKIEYESIINLIDVTGAGDVVLSVLVYVFIKEKDLLKACKIANYIGGKSVCVIGNYNVNLNDINEYDALDINTEKTKILYDYETDKITKISKNNKNIVFTNGCFDILHSAHIELLKFSKKQGDVLVVGLNSDESIKRLKGETRPINDIEERSKILSLFDFIDYIIIFSDDTPLNIIKALKPDILIKGSDYNKDNIIGKEYVKNIILFDFVQNKSSSRIINKITNLYKKI